MDVKVTLSFDKEVVEKAKAYAQKHHISLSHLTEYLYRQIIENPYMDLADFPVSEWVNSVSEGDPEFKRTPSRSQIKKGFYESRR